MRTDTGINYSPITVTLVISLLLVSVTGCASTSSPSTPPTPSIQTTPSNAQWQPDGVIAPGEYSGSSNYGAYSIYWRSDGQYLFIGMMAKTAGWVAVALQPGSRMKDSDMILGYVTGGKAIVLDLYCTDNLGSHPADTDLGGSYDIIVSGGREENGITIIEFKRSLNTGDKYDIPVSKGINKIMWAYGSGDNPSTKHIERGYGEIDH